MCKGSLGMVSMQGSIGVRMLDHRNCRLWTEAAIGSEFVARKIDCVHRNVSIEMSRLDLPWGT